jgi:hypothetical protein
MRRDFDIRLVLPLLIYFFSALAAWGWKIDTDFHNDFNAAIKSGVLPRLSVLDAFLAQGRHAYANVALLLAIIMLIWPGTEVFKRRIYFYALATAICIWLVNLSVF